MAPALVLVRTRSQFLTVVVLFGYDLYANINSITRVTLGYIKVKFKKMYVTNNHLSYNNAMVFHLWCIYICQHLFQR